MTRWRWQLWILFIVVWTVALLYPISRIGRHDLEDPYDLLEIARFVFAKTVHLAAYALLTYMTGWLRAPMRYRVLLMFVLMAHATLGEVGQLVMKELDWSTRTGELRDVVIDDVGILIGLLLSWKWWTVEGSRKG